MEVGETGSLRRGGRPTSKGHHRSTSADPAHLLNHHPGDVAGEEWRFVSLGFLFRGFKLKSFQSMFGREKHFLDLRVLHPNTKHMSGVQGWVRTPETCRSSILRFSSMLRLST